ncbi:GNAT family N-acetyltransferase [Hwanghaeella sp.]|uniref:GNAT family N-acetyltransferase n=1 Tax=Hwanghaeella sp. TaxID=2605943 RepID=UPI003CCBF5BB
MKSAAFHAHIEGEQIDLASSLAALTNGSLEIRIGSTEADILASQALRYRIFYEEMSAKPSAEMAAALRDFDEFDAVADHLQVVDHDLGSGPESVVGTYRLMRREQAERHGRFYSIDEYDISPITSLPCEILELGRSCVDERYRTRRVMELLWRGIAAYVFHYDIEIMFGCASLPGTDVETLALPLSYLYHYHKAPPELCPKALPDRYVDMNVLPIDAVDRKAGLLAVPPLVKGYLRLGGFVGDGAVIDPQFNTTDVCVIVKTDQVTGRYFKHYARHTGDG